LAGLVAAGCLFVLSGCSETPDTEEVAKAKAAAERAEEAAGRAEEAVKMLGGGPVKHTQQVASNDDSADTSSSEDSVSPVIINEDGTADGDVGPPAAQSANNRE
jgi:hypothetical protein